MLADLERRREYDRGAGARGRVPVEAAVSFEGFDFSAPAEGPLAATFSELFADVFQDAAREATTPSRGGRPRGDARRCRSTTRCAAGSFRCRCVRQERCPACGGDGRVPRAAGRVSGVRRAGRAAMGARAHGVHEAVRALRRQRPADDAGLPRRARGVGVQARSEVVTVAVPPGIEAGARVAVPGRGHAGARGGPAGDLYVTVDVARASVSPPGRPRPAPDAAGRGARGRARRAGRRADARRPRAAADSAGHVVGPPAARAGPRRAVRERRREAGDLIVEMQIVLPPVRDERSRELLQEFGRLNDVDVRASVLFECSEATAGHDR